MSPRNQHITDIVRQARERGIDNKSLLAHLIDHTDDEELAVYVSQMSDRSHRGFINEAWRTLQAAEPVEPFTIAVYRTALVRDGSAPWPSDEHVGRPEYVVEFFNKHFADRCEEEFWIVLLDTANHVIGLSRLSVGGLAASIVEPRAVFRTAVLANAAALICVHNHPSGNPEPSEEDVRITRQLVEAGKLMGIPVHDHLIIIHQSYTSLAERGLMG